MTPSSRFAFKQLDRESAVRLDRADPVIVHCHDTQ
jgi:hypothetical protein